MSKQPRRGVVSLWVVLVAPALLLLLCCVADIGKLWLARVELTTALESASLAAVKSWGDANGGSTAVHRNLGVAFAAANTIGGEPLVLGVNDDAGSLPNENASCAGNVLVFGATVGASPNLTFDASLAPDNGAGQPFAVHAKATVSVTSLCDNVLGLPIGPYQVTAEATAVYDAGSQQPQIVHVEQVLCGP